MHDNVKNKCRICFDEVNDIKQYCDCEGSIQPIHFHCLEKWIKVRDNNLTCEICKGEYRLKSNYSYVNKLNIYMFLCLLFVNLFFMIFFWIGIPYIYKRILKKKINTNLL